MHRSCLSSWSWQLASDRPKTFSAMNDARLNLNTNPQCTLLNIHTHARARIIPACHWCDSEKCQVTRMLCMNTLNASIDSMKLLHQINRNNQWCVCLRAWRHASRDCLSVCHSPARDGDAVFSRLEMLMRWRPLLKPSRPQSETAPQLSAPRTVCAPLCACAPLSLFTRALTNQSVERKLTHEY